MDSNDKKIKSIMAETLKELVVPRLEKIETKQEKHDERFNKIEKKLSEHDGQFKSHGEKLEEIIKKLDVTFDAVGDTKVEATILQENISDQGYTLERMETKLDSTVHRQDDFSVKASQLNRRVLRLETKKA